jgi:predicted O-methyltransferase YrrM
MRYDIINALIKKHDYKSYLEIGVQTGRNFEKIDCYSKIGVDPEPILGIIGMTSDEYFSQNHLKFDLIFIDGLHHAEQVYKDIINSLNCLDEGGTIVCFDDTATTEIMQKVPREVREWTGNGWKALSYMYWNYDLNINVVDTDYGVGIIEKFEEGEYYIQSNFEMVKDVTWDDYANYTKWIGVITPKEFTKRLNG